MANGKRLADWCRAQIGRTYDDIDCKGLIVEGIRTVGETREEQSYRCAGTNELWRSMNASGKYRYITARTPIKEAERAGLLRPGAILAIHEEGYNAKYDDWEGDCSHVAVYIGGEDIEAIHSSATRGKVCQTMAKNGFTHVLSHRLIDLDDAAPATDEEETIAEIEMIVVTDKDPLNIREKPTAKSERVGSAAQGAKVTVTGAAETDETGRAWVPVRHKPANRRTEIRGWACMDYLAIDGSGEETCTEESCTSPADATLSPGTGDMVSIPREVLLRLADAANDAESTFEGTWSECIKRVNALIAAARNATDYLRGDD